jgi:hypothetical protein
MVSNQNKKVMDLLTKRLFSTCFLPLAVTFTLHTGTPVVFEKPDTVTVHSTGINKRVVIDSPQLNESFDEPVLSPVKGEIIQTGENNRVEINTSGEVPNNKLQKTNNLQITNSKNQISNSTKPETCNVQRVTIKQTGKNNSVKINSR